MTYVPFQVFSTFSVGRAYSRVDSLVAKAYDLKLPGLALTDIHSVSGWVQFLKAIEKGSKKAGYQMRALLGCTISIKTDTGISGLTVLCRNITGYATLRTILGLGQIERGEPYVTLQDVLDNLSNDLIYIHGGPGSLMWDEIKNTGSSTSYEVLKQHKGISPLHFVIRTAHGLTNQLAVQESIQTKYAPVPWIDGNAVYYPSATDVLYQRLIRCGWAGTTFTQIDKTIALDPINEMFFKTDRNHLEIPHPTPASLELLTLCEPFSIALPPQIPQVKVEGKLVEDADQMLLDICRKGWVKRNLKNAPKQDVYVNRIKYELDILKRGKLSTYMLIVQDFLAFCRKHGQMAGLRGSAAGCLVSYLSGIGSIDPVRPDPSLPYHPERELPFARFFNPARLGSLPDIDIDVPISFREKLIEHLRNSYGADCVAHIITHNTLKGKGALKEVFRIMDPVPNSFEVCNEITKHFIEEAKVQDILEDIRAETPDYNIIDYNIDNVPAVADAYAEYKEAFDIARKLANTISSHGKHAAGIVIASRPLHTFLPMTPDPKTGKPIVAFSMTDCEFAGGVKYDVLGVAAYEKLNRIQQMVNEGLNSPVVGFEDDFEIEEETVTA